MANLTATPLEDFAGVLEQLTNVLVSLSEIEGQKAEAAAGRHHDRISGFLNPEQALMLKLRGLEQKRSKLADALGWQGLTFRQILDRADSSEQALLVPHFTELERQVKQLAEVKAAADRIIRLRLREFQSALDGSEPSYNGDKQAATGMQIHLQDKYV